MPDKKVKRLCTTLPAASWEILENLTAPGGYSVREAIALSLALFDAHDMRMSCAESDADAHEMRIPCAERPSRVRRASSLTRRIDNNNKAPQPPEGEPCSSSPLSEEKVTVSEAAKKSAPPATKKKAAGIYSVEEVVRRMVEARLGFSEFWLVADAGRDGMFREWAQYRQSAKEPYRTPAAVTRLMGKLHKLATSNEHACDLLAEAMERGWLTVFDSQVDSVPRTFDSVPRTFDSEGRKKVSAVCNGVEIELLR